MTIAEFLAWEERQGLRYEFDGIRPVPMAEVTLGHAQIQANLIGLLRSRMRRGAGQVFGSSLKIEVADCIRYPDAFVVCTRWPGDATVIHDPALVFEILSPATISLDRITKNREYAATPSVRRYVMLEHDRIAATVFARTAGEWLGHLLGEGDALRLPEIGLELALAELYEGVDLPADPDAVAGDT